jgi:hypothetical protein
MSVWTTSPVGIGICCQSGWRIIINVKTMIKSTFEVTKNSFDIIIVGNTRIMHEKIGLLDGIGEFRSSKSEVL